jgi:glucose/arabinose dehydrogenase
MSLRSASLVRPAIVIIMALAVLLPAGAAHAAVSQSINFQPSSAPVPSGFVADTGAAFSNTLGRGWVRQDSLTQTTHTPLNITANTRDRNVNTDQRLDTFIHMQYPDNGSTANVMTPAAWEIAAPSGRYQVTVAIGDPGAEFDSRHWIRVEGVATIVDFVPTTNNRFASATIAVDVTDGRLTIDALGGTNTKLDYVTLASVESNAPPTAPTNLRATAGDGFVDLIWNANSEGDLAGYRVYRSTTSPVPTTGTPISGATPITAATMRDTTAANGTAWRYVVVAVDTAGNASTASNEATASTATAIDVKFNFQPASAPVPSGYVADTGAAYSAAAGRGWVRQDSLSSATHVALNVAPNARDRNVITDQRLDTFMHMQYPISGTANVVTPAAWEYAVPDGTYMVGVGVGDSSAEFDSTHRISAEDVELITGFTPTSGSRSNETSRAVTVQDGRLTIDAIGGTNTKLDYVTIRALSTTNPEVTATNPADGATGVARDAAVTAEVHMPNAGAGIDPATLTASSVRIVRDSDNTAVSAQRNTTGGGDAIVVKPTALLAASTKYRFEVLATLRDTSGTAFIARTTTFTTGTATTPPPSTTAAFDQVQQPTAQGRPYTSLTFGPDGKLYAGTYTGDIVRWPVATDGTLGSAEVLSALPAAKGTRAVLGLTFDPAATASNLVLWVTDNQAVYDGASDWTGAITRLSGPSLGTVQTWVSGLPRSVADHETNSIAFGPDGAMYLTQGSNSAMGAADTVWGNRPERLLSGAVLRLEPNKVTSPPLDARTEAGGNYNPRATGAPLTLYATGVRNAYDLVWHSNGNLYSPGNGSAAGGNTPATPSPLPASCANRIDAPTRGSYTGPSVPGRTGVADSEHDYAFTIRAGGYYGHPNPLRCEWTLAGGNPTSQADPFEIRDYPVGTAPDRNFRLADTFDMGVHQSPDGTIEWRGTQFNGALDHKLLVARYSAGKDIVALDTSGPNGAINGQTTGIPGFTGLSDPLDLAQRPGTGQLYVSELGSNRVTLLRARAGSASVDATPSMLVMSDPIGDTTGSVVRTVHVENTGSTSATVTALTLGGAQAARFALVSPPSLPRALVAGASFDVGVRLVATTAAVADATLTITSTGDPTSRVISLRGLGIGADEPSLQRILDTWRINASVGDPDPATSDMPIGGLLGQEVTAQRFTRAAPGNVTIVALASFVPTGPAGVLTRMGWIPAGTPGSVNALFTVGNDQASRLGPDVVGARSFDPGTAAFSFRSVWPSNSDAVVYQEDALNTFPNAFPHHVRTYPLRDAVGTIVANAYVMGFEAITAAADEQDIVMIVRNVRPV